MKRKLMLLLAGLFTCICLVTAQNLSVTGIVVSEEDGEPVVGASVLVKGTTIGTITNIDGQFNLPNVPKSSKVLQVSYIGMQTQEVPIKATLKITLKPDAQSLDEVVVVAYGTVKKQSLVGAQASVSAKQLENRPVTNITNALSGIAPGVQVTTSTGQPGSSSSIRIRGFGSINASSDPLYVVDGTIYNGSISDIPAQDIENISILKDAAATSLYGSSAGNGVILVTTKSGSKSVSGKPSFTFTMNQGFSQKGQSDYDKIGVMDYYKTRWQQWYNEYKYDRNWSEEKAGSYAAYAVYDDLRYNPYAGIKSVYEENASTGELTVTQNPQSGSFTFPAIVMPNGELNPEINGLLWGEDLDWEKDLFRTGSRNEYSLSGSYNNDKVTTFFSLGYINEDGYRIRTNYQRYNGRTNLSYQVNKWVKIGTNLSFSRSHDEAPKTSSGSSSSNSFAFVRGIAPIYPIHMHNEDGTYILDDKGNKRYDHSDGRPYNSRFNPIEESYLDLSTTDRDALNSRTFADIELTKDLKFRTNIAYDLYNSISKLRYNNEMGDQPAGLLRITNKRGTTVTFNQLLEYNKYFGDHKLNVMLGHEAYMLDVQSVLQSKKGMGFLGYDEMENLSETYEQESYTNKYRKEGYFGRINYDYSDLYNVSASYRRDGTSRLHPDSRWGNFWSIGAGWNAHNESFLKNISWLNALKVRASIGQTGNDALSSYYAYQTTYGFGNNNNNIAGLRLNTFGNKALKWETQTSYDLAFEFGVFNRLNGSIELFNKESKDLIFPYPLPASTGIGSIDENIGKVRNYGIEMNFTVNLLKNKDWNWDFKINGTILKNRIVELPEGNKENGIELSHQKYMEGHSIYDYFLNEWIGVDPSDGKAMYRLDNERYPDNADPNSPNFEGVEKEGEKATWTKNGNLAKKHYCGTSIPDIYGGFGSNLTWKSFDLNVYFSYQLGGKTYDSGYAGLMGRRLKSGSAMHIDMKNAWRQPGDITNVPRLDAGTSGQFDGIKSDRFLVSSSALMLKSLSIGYQLPKKWAQKVKLGNVRLSLAGENLFLLSKRKGLNPMKNYSGVVESAFYDYSKTITSSITVSF